MTSRRFLTRNRNDRSGSSGDYKCSHSVVVDAGRWGDDARISDLEPKFALGLRRKAAGECLDGRFQTYCGSRARTLMTERAVHLPPRPEGNPRSLSALAVAFALSPAYSAKISLSCRARASASFRPTGSCVHCGGIGLQLFGFDWSSKRA